MAIWENLSVWYHVHMLSGYIYHVFWGVHTDPEVSLSVQAAVKLHVRCKGTVKSLKGAVPSRVFNQSMLSSM